MEEALKALLAATAGVTALAPAARINWGARAQGAALPALVLNVISDVEEYTLQAGDGLFRARVQADCYAVTTLQAKQLSRAVRAVLSGYRGGNFRLVEHVATRDSRESGTNEADRPYRRSLDFETFWKET
jgi:hypothetical protein